MRNQYTCDIDAIRGVIPEPNADDDYETFLYEFVGDISEYDLKDLVNENDELEDHGYSAEELLRDALLHYNSTFFEAEKREEVLNLLKHIFDPKNSVFFGKAFTYNYFENDSANHHWGGPLLVYTRYAGRRMTKLILKFRTQDRLLPEENRRLQILCITYETLSPNPKVHRT